jgi:hypothetical protein
MNLSQQVGCSILLTTIKQHLGSTSNYNSKVTEGGQWPLSSRPRPFLSRATMFVGACCILTPTSMDWLQ